MIGLYWQFSLTDLFTTKCFKQEISLKNKLKDKFTSEATAKVLEGTKVRLCLHSKNSMQTKQCKIVTKHLENGKVLLDEKRKKIKQKLKSRKQ